MPSPGLPPHKERPAQSAEDKRYFYKKGRFHENPLYGNPRHRG